MMQNLQSAKRYKTIRVMMLWVIGLGITACAAPQRVLRDSPIIITDTQSRKYNLQLDFMKHHFSGLLIVRRLPGDEIRILASTYFGLSLFDFSLRPDTFEVNSCIEPMRKEKILRLLESDLKKLFLGNQLFRMKKRNSTSEKRITGRNFGKTVVTLSQFANDEPGQVRIKHPWMGLSIQVNRLEENITQ